MALRSGAQVFITDCVFDDNDYGLSVGFNSYGYVDRSTFSNNFWGALVAVGSYLSLSDVSITGRGQGTGRGVYASRNSTAELDPGAGTLSNQVSDFAFGVVAQRDSRVEIFEMGITGNTFGVFIDKESFLEFFGGAISNNTSDGVFFRHFSHGIIDSGTTFSGNGNDTATDATSDFIFN